MGPSAWSRLPPEGCKTWKFAESNFLPELSVERLWSHSGFIHSISNCGSEIRDKGLTAYNTGRDLPGWTTPVFVAYNLFTLRADHVDYDAQTRTLQATGNVVIVNAGGETQRVDFPRTFKIEQTGQSFTPLPDYAENRLRSDFRWARLKTPSLAHFRMPDQVHRIANQFGGSSSGDQYPAAGTSCRGDCVRGQAPSPCWSCDGGCA